MIRNHHRHPWRKGDQMVVTLTLINELLEDMTGEKSIEEVIKKRNAVEAILETGEERDNALLGQLDYLNALIEHVQSYGYADTKTPGPLNYVQTFKLPDRMKTPDVSNSPGAPKSQSGEIPQKVVYGQGATRNDIGKARYDLLDPWAIQEIAEVYGEGAESHGDTNWLKGMPESVIWNHLERHINEYKKGDRSEPHLGKAIWGLMALIRYRENPPVLEKQETEGDALRESINEDAGC